MCVPFEYSCSTHPGLEPDKWLLSLLCLEVMLLLPWSRNIARPWGQRLACSPREGGSSVISKAFLFSLGEVNRFDNSKKCSWVSSVCGVVASVFWAFHDLSKIEKFYRGSGSPHGLWSESGHVIRWGNIAFSGVWLVDNNHFPILKLCYMVHLCFVCLHYILNATLTWQGRSIVIGLVKYALPHKQRCGYNTEVYNRNLIRPCIWF